MTDRGFNYEFTKKELKYLLFAKKNCPLCGKRMEKRTSQNIVYGNYTGFFTKKKTEEPDWFIRKKRVSYFCNSCKKEFSLQNLAHEN